jgi:hypothetical protein
MYNDATPTKTLWWVQKRLDAKDKDGAILTLQKWDLKKESKNWEYLTAKYKEDPSKPGYYLPISSIAYAVEGSKERWEREWDYTTKNTQKYEVNKFDSKNVHVHQSIIYDDNSYRTVALDKTAAIEWSEIEQFYYDFDKRATAKLLKKVTYDDGRSFEERWDLLDDDAAVDGDKYTNGWNHIYREWDKTGALVRHWYIDDLGWTHYIDTSDTTDDQFPDQPLPDDDGDDSSHLASILATKSLHASWM